MTSSATKSQTNISLIPLPRDTLAAHSRLISSAAKLMSLTIESSSWPSVGVLTSRLINTWTVAPWSTVIWEPLVAPEENRVSTKATLGTGVAVGVGVATGAAADVSHDQMIAGAGRRA